MSDIVTIGERAANVTASQQFENYSQVIIHVSDEKAYTAGSSGGLTLEIDNPYGTQAMANNMLAALAGFQYQPFTAEETLLDPAAEIGDAVSVHGVYGGIYKRERTFGRLMKADISAPKDEELNHEYQYESPERREFKRELDEVRASLKITNDEITASVVKKTGGSTSSFGWALNAASHVWYANGHQVMRVNEDGLSIAGNIIAQSGTIGGFTIGKTAIYNNLSSYGGTATNGVYIGTNGIQLGQNFKVSTGGVVSAVSMKAKDITLSGTLTIGGKQITAAALQQGAQSAYSNGSRWTSGAAGGERFDSMSNPYNSYPINASSFRYNGSQYVPTTISFLDYYGHARSWTVLALAGG